MELLGSLVGGFVVGSGLLLYTNLLMLDVTCLLMD